MNETRDYYSYLYNLLDIKTGEGITGKQGGKKLVTETSYKNDSIS